jgi:hypothetical protein
MEDKTNPSEGETQKIDESIKPMEDTNIPEVVSPAVKKNRGGGRGFTYIIENYRIRCIAPSLRGEVAAGTPPPLAVAWNSAIFEGKILTRVWWEPKKPLFLSRDGQTEMILPYEEAWKPWIGKSYDEKIFRDVMINALNPVVDEHLLPWFKANVEPIRKAMGKD